MYSAILEAAGLVSVVILLVMMLVLGNTIAMGVRERVPEYGVLRAIGFLPGHVALWVVGESVATAVVGGVVGAALSWPLVDRVVRPFVEDRVGSFFPYFQLEVKEVLLGLPRRPCSAPSPQAFPRGRPRSSASWTPCVTWHDYPDSGAAVRRPGLR